MNTRAKFEEIWPVPDGVYWDSEDGEYMPREWLGADKYFELATEWDARLDTFTRCQETMGPVISLADELVSSIERAEILICNIDAPTTGSGYSELMDWTEFETDKILGRAKQILGREK